MLRLFVLGLALWLSDVAWAEEPVIARVCFVRHEQAGRSSPAAVQIYGTHADREQMLATLAPGAEACVDIEPGDWSFEARSSQPSKERPGKAKACRSNPLMTDATAETPTTIEVSLKPKASANACGWRLRRQRDTAGGR